MAEWKYDQLDGEDENEEDSESISSVSTASSVFTLIVTEHGSIYKKLSNRRVTARCVLSVVILPITTQQCRNYLYDKS